MDNKQKLNLQAEQYQSMIQKFKQREEQTSLQEALVYLKLRDYQCDNSKALIFAKKKEKCIDGTIRKDGPPGFKKLQVLRPQSKLVNGWLRGQKLKYAGTTGYTGNLQQYESLEKRNITIYNQKARDIEQKSRQARSKSLVAIDVTRPKDTIQKIGAIKEDASKQRENRNLFVQFEGVRLDQTTKYFFKEAESINDQGLIIKLAVFDQIISNPNLELKVDANNLKGKSFTNNQLEASKKRESIINYQQQLDNYLQKDKTTENTSHNKWKAIVQHKANNQHQMLFKRGSVDSASNALILMNSKQLKRELSSNSVKFGERMTEYSKFYKQMDRAVEQEFLAKRQFGMSDFSIKRKSINQKQT